MSRRSSGGRTHKYDDAVQLERTTTIATDDRSETITLVAESAASLSVSAPERSRQLDHALADEIARLGPDVVEVKLWIKAVDDASDGVAAGHGFAHWRDLWQMRCPLPAAESGLDTRPFTEADIDRYVAVNNRAFDWHPEQSGLTAEAVRATMAEPWFDPDGFRLYEENDELLGFCFTKVHADHDPVLGEIYVIAVDPSAHGRGLGVPMTLAGLEWLSARSIEVAMLYVESDNDPAVATYHRIGFDHHQTDRAYRLTVGDE